MSKEKRMSGIVAGKKILIMGLRNKWSIAWGITKKLYEEGAELAFTYQGDRDEAGVRNLLNSLCGDGEAENGVAPEADGALECGGESKLTSTRREDFPLIKCDLLGADSEIDAAFAEIGKIWGSLDGVVHAIANARTEDLQNDFILTSREGFAHALNASVYTLVYVSRKASELMTNGGGAILTLTYMGSERVFPGYNVMGVAKAALEAAVRYLANSLGPKGIRVNAISSGPIKTISSKAVKNFSDILSVVDEKAPLKRGVDAEEVGGAAVYLLSGLSSAVTGEIHYVDCGFNIMGI
jgi:enoyl-[acyl-carrier protein] reductase I